MNGQTLQLINTLEQEDSVPIVEPSQDGFLGFDEEVQKPILVYMLHFHDKHGFWSGKITIPSTSKNRAHRKIKKLFPTFVGVPVFIHPTDTPRKSLSLHLGHGAGYSIDWVEGFVFKFGCTPMDISEWMNDDDFIVPDAISSEIKSNISLGKEKINMFFKGLYEWNKLWEVNK